MTTRKVYDNYLIEFLTDLCFAADIDYNGERNLDILEFKIRDKIWWIEVRPNKVLYNVLVGGKTKGAIMLCYRDAGARKPKNITPKYLVQTRRYYGSDREQVLIGFYSVIHKHHFPELFKNKFVLF